MKKTLTLPRVLGLGMALAAAASAADAKESWDKTCSKCHGADGKGQTKIGQKLGIKDLSDAAVQAGFKDEEAVRALKFGLKDKDDKTLMKQVEGMSDADISGLVAYVRGLKK